MVRLLRREQAIVMAALLMLTLLAWAYLVWDAARMSAMPMSAAPAIWTAAKFAMVFAMWAIMMVAMMLPSAAPMILLYARIVRTSAQRGVALPAVWHFTAGYLLVWTAFSLIAAILQMLLDRALLLSPMMISTSAMASGAILIAAGTYQWLPIKEVCLHYCRSPAQFLAAHMRPGKTGALKTGVLHGAFCVGCCWALMLLLFVGGVMNLLWVLLIAGFVIIEKLIPGGPLFGRLAGVLLCCIGVWQMTRAAIG